MTLEERLRTVWAEWAPYYQAGRLDLGPLVIYTRKELQRQTWRTMRMGVAVEGSNPGVVDRMVAELDGEAPEATVHHLHAV